MNTINWGILGCGNVTEVKSGPAFNLVNNSQLVAVMRRHAAKAEDYARRHRVSKWYSNADDLINDPDVNAIYVATPPNAHAELTIKALQATKPVYVEKPMALNHAQALEMIQAAEKYKTPLFVAYYRRALPGFLKVKSLIESGAIGSIRMVTMQLYKALSFNKADTKRPWRVQPEIAGGGHFFDLASHQLDFMDFLFGPVKEIKAFALNQAKQYSAEDIISASFLMENGVLVSGSWCFTIPDFLEKDSIEIIGEKGAISFSCFGFEPVQLKTKSGIQFFEYPKPRHVQQDLIQLVVDELQGKGKSPSTAYSSARTNWVMDEVVNKYYKKFKK
ncbi:MAG: oxidoreductase [Bacteroidetes bacterium HGW-Bacteroidetes-4]|nr:MAG: oxidoreductase [Bacteroidetes bacterium HGW-Bacteroidetes-4]